MRQFDLRSYNELISEIEKEKEIEIRFKDNPNIIDDKEIPLIFQPIDFGIDELLKNITKNSRIEFPPLEIEHLSGTLQEHLDICMNLYQQGQNLEVAILSEGLSFVFEKELYNNIEKSNVLDQKAASRILSNTFDAQYDTENNSIENGEGASKYFDQLQSIKDENLSLRKANLDARIAYFNKKGSGTHYLEKFEHMRKLFHLEIKEAYLRSLALAHGVTKVYQTHPEGLQNIDVPIPTESGYLHQLYTWARQVSYMLERTILRRDESVIIIPLFDSGSNPGDEPPTKGVLPRSKFNESIEAGTVKFTLEEKHFEKGLTKITKPLLRGIDLADIPVDVHDLQNDSHIAMSLKPPSITIENSAGQSIYSLDPELLLPNVRNVGNKDYLGIIFNQIHNVNPIGDWELKLQEASWWRNHRPSEDENLIVNIFLILRVTHEI